MAKIRIDPQETPREIEEDYNAAQNMIGEGAPDYSNAKDDDAPQEIKNEAQQAKRLQ
jgi:hypothetical protein